MEYKVKEPGLKGSSGKDGKAYSEMGGGSGSMKKGSSKLDALGGVKGKDGAQYKEVNNQKKQAGAE